MLTLRSPAEAARALIARNLPMNTRWMALIVAVSLSALMNWVLTRMLAPEVSPEAAAASPMMTLSSQPLLLAAMQFGAVVTTAALMDGVGRVFGGRGNFADALLLVTWIEVMLLVVQILQVVFLMILPPLAALMGLIALVLFVGLTVIFTKTLHGFESTLKVVFGVLMTAIAAVFVLSFIAAAFGVLPGMPNGAMPGAPQP
ncbi:YIP1 family protein [Paracoccus albicereus]|nr:YIP1 family protein [Paracoccus albicereus]